jgi:hypothetical protein
MLDIRKLNTNLNRVINGSNFKDVQSRTNDNSKVLKALTENKKVKTGSSENGIKFITTETGKQGLSILNKDVPNISDQLVKKLEGDKTELSKIVSDIDDGFLDLSINSPTIESLKISLNNIANVSNSDLENICYPLLDDSINDKITEAVKLDYSQLSKRIKDTIKSCSVTKDKVDISSNSIKKQINDTSLIFDNKFNLNKWNGSNTSDDIFTEVTSMEELMIDLNRCEREITQLIFVAYECDVGRSYSSSDIHEIENRFERDGISANYIIRTDGVVQRGRPVDVSPNFDDNHNKNSILVGVVLIGNNINVTQGKTVKTFLESYYNSWPGGSVYGANYIDPEYNPPGFNPIEYVELYGKTNYSSAEKTLNTIEMISNAKNRNI